MLAGELAITRHDQGRGTATYVSCRADDRTLHCVLAGVVERAGVRPMVRVHGEVAVTRRVDVDGTSYLFLINSSGSDAAAEAGGTDLLTGDHHDGVVTVPAGGVVVLREAGA